MVTDGEPGSRPGLVRPAASVCERFHIPNSIWNKKKRKTSEEIDICLRRASHILIHEAINNGNKCPQTPSPYCVLNYSFISRIFLLFLETETYVNDIYAVWEEEIKNDKFVSRSTKEEIQKEKKIWKSRSGRAIISSPPSNAECDCFGKRQTRGGSNNASYTQKPVGLVSCAHISPDATER